MIKSIANLWNGNLEPISRFGKNNGEMKELERLIGKSEEKIEGILNEEQKKVIKNYTDLLNEYLIVSNEQAFCDGFCVGTRLFFEAFSGAQDLL